MIFKGMYVFLKDKVQGLFRGDDQDRLQQKIHLVQIGQWTLGALVFVLILLLALAKLQSFALYSVIFALGTVFYLLLRLTGLGEHLQMMKEVIECWGKEKRKKRDFSIITEYFQWTQERDSTFCIDDRTWADLNMDQIYEKMDGTITVPGEQYLYRLLRKPEFQDQELKRRNRVVQKIQENLGFRKMLQQSLVRIGRRGGDGFCFFLWKQLPAQRPLWIFRTLTLFSIIAVGLTIWNRDYWLLIALVFILNMFIHYNAKKRIAEYLETIFYLGRFLSGVHHLLKTRVDDPLMEPYYQELEKVYRPFRNISKQTSVFALKHNDNAVLMEYLFILFLHQVRVFYKILDQIKHHIGDLQKMYTLVGELDALLAIASYRTGLAYYSEPEFVEGSTYQVDQVYHPLLDDPVSNSFSLTENGMLLTGSNMSGKSTLLRAVGINVLLAQTIYTSVSKRYQGDYYQLLTSIGRSDNVISGESYYLVEAKALLRIIEKTGATTPVLCIVDEIFRGTNSQERIAASTEVLRYLAEHKCTIFAATHDLELTDLLAKVMENYHFRETVDEKGLSFDYQLKPGPSTSRNAIQLLDFLGYPTQIVDSARERVEESTMMIGEIS